MTIYIFGNPDLKFDSLPLKILPDLRKAFPDIKFQIKDPNEEWSHNTGREKNKLEKIRIVDTVFGIDKVTVFQDISVFKKSPRFSLHDFDLYADLMLMKKLGKLPDFTIIGIPPNYDSRKAISEASSIIKPLLK